MEINQLIKDGMKYQEAVEFIEYNTNKPFDLELNKIYNIDAFNLLAELDENSVDLLILDPNYQDWVDFNKRGLMVEAVRVLKKTGNILCFTKQPFDFELRNEVNHIFRREIVWTFTNGGAWVSNRMPLVSHQKIYHCVVDSKKSFFNERTGIDYSETQKTSKEVKKYLKDMMKMESNLRKAKMVFGCVTIYILTSHTQVKYLANHKNFMIY
jgi:DNA modification methylase